MIYYSDVEQHLQALNPEVASEEISATYRYMCQLCASQAEELARKVCEQWETILGVWPSSAEWEQINHRAQIVAASRVYQDFLSPITEEIINRELEEEEEEIARIQSELLNDPIGWITDSHLVHVEPWINDLTIKVWPEASPRWLMYAATYCQRQYYLQLALPAIDAPEINSVLAADITNHLRAQKVDMPETR
ncbi:MULTISPECIES: hypothetical protein [unclassified Corynebacterium]|uniref:hypothetical protein n=1 Tax=unclassified Corynebacterium TaxID=2624378 RepID=UPI0029CA9903|nr:MULTISPECIES: hypothetical protein [unclassified Corynebacterium]WPF67067.1 hypothetical protein OLX12_04935 [Corynebacterium sp. 22KM0430]WPF69554.1 hypothetical protein OLW90_04925 [Corynebacterium sp. 21KM1197]